MKLSAIKVDARLIEEGGWVRDIPGMGDLELRVRGSGNADFRRLQAKLVAEVPPEKRRRGRIDEAEHDRITQTCVLETVLLDWRNLVGDDSAPVPYSRETAERLLRDPDYAALLGAVVWASNVVAEEWAAGIEADAKN